jgi:hypothetical protein
LVRGDRVEIVIDAGGEIRTYEVVASRNGRRVEINTGRGIVEVTEVTRSGTPVRTARFMATRRLLSLSTRQPTRTLAKKSSIPVRPANRPDLRGPTSTTVEAVILLPGDAWDRRLCWLPASTYD